MPIYLTFSSSAQRRTTWTLSSQGHECHMSGMQPHSLLDSQFLNDPPALLPHVSNLSLPLTRVQARVRCYDALARAQSFEMSKEGYRGSEGQDP